VEKALGDSVVPAITLSAHAGFNAMIVQKLTMAVRGILAAAITVKDQAFGGLSFPKRHPHGAVDQVGGYA
jgi:hypothetical protein